MDCSPGYNSPHRPIPQGRIAVRPDALTKEAIMKPETQAIHAGHHIDPASGALTQPIYLSTTFERAADGEAADRGRHVRRQREGRAVAAE